MKIRMNTLMSGPNGTRHPGEVCIVEADEAEMLVKAGYAESAEAEKVADEAEETTADAESAEAEKVADEAEETTADAEPAEAEKGNHRKGVRK